MAPSQDSSDHQDHYIFNRESGTKNLHLPLLLGGGHIQYVYIYIYPGIPTTIKTMGVNITTIVYIRVLIIQIGSTIILMVVEAQGIYI